MKQSPPNLKFDGDYFRCFLSCLFSFYLLDVQISTKRKHQKQKLKCPDKIHITCDALLFAAPALQADVDGRVIG